MAAIWCWYLLLAAAVLGLLVWPGALAVLRWEHAALPNGEPWRWLTAHLVHLNALHALANLAGLALVIEWLGRSVRPQLAWLLALASALSVSACLAYFSPQISWYAGMSGVVHGLWAGLALLEWRGGRHRLAAFALALLALKLTCLPSPGLVLAGLQPDSQLGVLLGAQQAVQGAGLMAAQPVLTQAHGYGVLGGSLAALAILAGQYLAARWRAAGRRLNAGTGAPPA